MISVDEARDLILSRIPVLPSEEVALLDALYRVLDEDVYSDSDIPPFDNSAMDGYAVRAEDVAGASADNPVVLDVLEDLAAGYVAERSVRKGAAIRIMTGAPMPKGADSVVKVEETERSDGSVKVFKAVKGGENVRFAGEDVKEGELVLGKGKLLGPGDIGMLASIGKASVRAIRRPTVAVISTGDELVDIGEPLAPGKIRNSNAYSIGAQVLEAGAIPLMVGIARDARDDLVEKIEKGLQADVLVTSGGIRSREAGSRRAGGDRPVEGGYEAGQAAGFRHRSGQTAFWTSGVPHIFHGELRAVRAAGHPQDVGPERFEKAGNRGRSR